MRCSYCRFGSGSGRDEMQAWPRTNVLKIEVSRWTTTPSLSTVRLPFR